MTFSKLAYNRQFLRALAGEKVAGSFGTAMNGAVGTVGTVARGVAKPLNWAWQKSMKQNGKVFGTIGLGAGLLGAGALAKRAINQTRAAYHGFQPQVQEYTRNSSSE
jgi:hypothetical protein